MSLSCTKGGLFVRMSALALCAWSSGDEGFVTQLDAAGSRTARLQDLGLVPGVWLRVIQPGSPMLVQVGETRLSLRPEDARCVGAVKLAPEAPPALGDLSLST